MIENLRVAPGWGETRHTLGERGGERVGEDVVDESIDEEGGFYYQTDGGGGFYAGVVDVAAV